MLTHMAWEAISVSDSSDISLSDAVNMWNAIGTGDQLHINSYFSELPTGENKMNNI